MIKLTITRSYVTPFVRTYPSVDLAMKATNFITDKILVWKKRDLSHGTVYTATDDGMTFTINEEEEHHESA